MPEFSSPNTAWPFGIFYSNPLMTSRWPRPNTQRIEARWIWPSTVNIDPICTRHYMQVNFSTTYPLITDWEWFWYDLVWQGPWHATADSGVSASGNQVLQDWKYLDPMPETGLPGVRVEQTIKISGDPDAFRWTEYVDNLPDQRYVYNQWYRHLGVPITNRESRESHAYPGSFPYKSAWWTPGPDCFDYSQF